MLFNSTRVFAHLSRMDLLCAVVACIAASASGAQPRPAAASNSSVGAAAAKVHVNDSHNQPVADVVMLCQLRPAAPLEGLVQETTAGLTDARGDVDAPVNCPAGSKVVFKKAGFGLVSYEAGKLPPKISLPVATVLSGTVIDDHSTSVADAVVGPIEPSEQEHEAHEAHPAAWPLMFAHTDAHGSFRVEDLPGQDYSFLIRAPGCQPTLANGRSGTPLQLLVNHGGTTVTGKLVGTKDHLPQSGVYIEAAKAQARLYEMTDQAGAFEFPCLPSGEWMFKAYLGPGMGAQSAQALAVGESARTSITLLLNQGAAIAGMVVDDETSLPLSGIAVGLAAGGLRTQVPTDASGGFRFEDVDALEHYSLRFDTLRYVRVLPDGETRDYYDLPPASGDDRTSVILALRKRAIVQGRVVNNTGAPVVDAQVNILSMDGPQIKLGKAGQERQERPAFRISTDANGAFKLGVYPGGRYEVTATTQDNLAAEPKRVEAFSTATAQMLELRVRSTIALAGLVVDENDAPVSNALVLAMPAGTVVSKSLTAYERAKYLSGRTNLLGEFSISGLAANQQVLLNARHPDFVGAATGSFTLGTAPTVTTDSVKLKFSGGNDFVAKVTDAAGAPVLGAELTIYFAEGLDGQQASRETDAAGRGTLRAVPARQIERVVVKHDAYADYEYTKPLALPLTNFTIKLSRRVSLTVKLEGLAADAKPGMAVLLFVEGQIVDPTVQSEIPGSESFTEKTRGLFNQNRANFPGLNPGWYKAAMAGAGGYAESKPVLLAGDSGTAEVTIQAPAEGTIHGRVTDKESGKAVAGATVTITPAAQLNQVQESTAQSVYSDAAGNFEMRNAAIGSVRVKVVAFGYPEYQETVESSPTNRLDVLLSNAPGALSGAITMTGKPVENALLVLSKSGTTEKPVASSVSDAAGRYALSGFPAGKYLLTIEAPAGTGDNTTRRSVEVTVTDANSKQDVDLPALVQVSGNVQLAGKVPRHSDGSVTTIMFSPKSGGGEGRTVQLTGEGTFATEIEPGSYNVGIEDRPGQDVVIGAQSGQQLNLNF